MTTRRNVLHIRSATSLGWRAFGSSLLFAAPLLFLGYSYGQLTDPPGSDTRKPKEIVASAGSYRLDWRLQYQLQMSLEPVGTSDEAGTLWLISNPDFHSSDALVLTKIDANGGLIGHYHPKIPLKPSEYVGDVTPAVSGKSVGLLANVVSGGRNMTFEGAFFVPVGTDGPGNPVRVANPGPQFRTLIDAGSNEFLAAGDQSPLTLLKLDSSGKVLWRRSFSPKLVLPEVSVGSSGNIFVLSQGGSYLLLQVLDPAGQIVRLKRISARQGTVVTNPDGGCSLLVSMGFDGKDNKVYLLTLSEKLAQLNRVETPLVGWGGRSYRLITTPHGHLLVGEGPAPNPQKEIPKVIAEFDRSDRPIWQQEISSDATPLLIPFPSGFYLLRNRFAGKSTDVEKYLY